MNFGLADPAELVPWDKNPRQNKNAVAAVKESILKFGFASPIVARPSDKRIIAGHTRHQAALELDLEEVPVRWVELTDEQAAGLTLADNRTGEIAFWDEDMLGEVLQELVQQGEELIEGLGWSESELKSYLEPVDLDTVQFSSFEPDAPQPDAPRSPLPEQMDASQRLVARLLDLLDQVRLNKAQREFLAQTYADFDDLIRQIADGLETRAAWAPEEE